MENENKKEVKNTVTVRIAGAQYTIRTEESADFTQNLVKEINSKINEIKTVNPYVSTSQIAILLALEYASECKKAQQRTETIRGEIKSYLEDAAKAQSERDFYKREIERMKAEAKSRSNQINLFSDDKNEG